MTRRQELIQELLEIEAKEPTVGYCIKHPKDVAPLLIKKIGRKKVEYFAVITLDAAHKVIKFHTVTIGLVNRTLVHPREIFRAAVKDNAVAIIIAHNHPGGKTYESSEDVEITKRLKQAGEIIGISVLDHIIVTKNGFCSFQGKGIL